MIKNNSNGRLDEIKTFHFDSINSIKISLLEWGHINFANHHKRTIQTFHFAFVIHHENAVCADYLEEFEDVFTGFFFIFHFQRANQLFSPIA